MAVKKTTKSIAKPEVEGKIESDATSTQVTVDANELIKSIMNNVGANNTEKPHAKEYIKCHSVTNGSLNINCSSGNVYEFNDYDDDCEIEYHDLSALVRKHSDHIFKPRIVIDDEDFIAEFPQIAKAYDKLYTMDDINTILSLPVNQMIREIENMPKAVHENLKSVVSRKVSDGSIDSISKIRALSSLYDADFNLLSELFAR